MQETGNNPNPNSLSIRFSAGGFSFSANGKTKSVEFTSPDNRFVRSRAVCLCQPEIWEDYRQITVQIDDEPTALVPSQVFTPNDCKSILKFNFPAINLSDYSIENESIEGFNITNIIAVDNELSQFIKEYLPFATISHISSTLIQKALRSSKIAERKEVWIYVAQSTLTLVVADSGTLLLSNRYQIKSNTDILYWVGAIYTHYNLSQQNTPLFITGDSNSASILQERVAHCNVQSI